jgi:thermitase
MMRYLALLILLAFILLAVFFTGCSEDQSPVEQTDIRLAPPIKDESLFDKGTILVKFKSFAIPRDINALISALGTTVKDIIPVLNVTVLKVPAGQAETFVQKFKRNPLVEYAELNGIARASYIPNDPYLSEQWGLSKVGASGAWDITKVLQELR